MGFSRYLSCPIVRPARESDAVELARMVINSESRFIDSVFGEQIEEGLEVLETQFKEYNEGLYVLMEGDLIVGAMKLHLPNQLIGSTLSYRKLISILGIKSGIRAGILFSIHDEYTVSPKEAYIEYIYIHQDWKNFNVREILLDKAYDLAEQVGAKYITYFTPTKDYEERGFLKDQGFVLRKKNRSLIARLVGSKDYTWYKATYTIIDGPITVKEYVVDKIDVMKNIWADRKREVFAAIRLTVALTVIPLVAGSLAFLRGYPVAAIGWGMIAVAHLLGAKLYLNGSMIGRYGLAIAIVAEGINLAGRSIMTQSWFDRTWLLATSLLAFWICYVVLKNSNQPTTKSSKSRKPVET